MGPVRQIVRQIAAGIIIYRRTKDGPRFLLLYHGGRYWNFPKGKAEKNETPESAALREVHEETGISRSQLRIDYGFRTQDGYTFREKKQKVFKTAYYFLGEVFSPHIKISREHQGCGWFLYRDGARMLIYQNLKNNLRRAYDHISRKSIPSAPARAKGTGYNVQGPSPHYRFSPRRPRSR